MLACPADGHFEATDEKVEFLALYIRKAAQYRLPSDYAKGGGTGAPKLIDLDPTKTGWLIDRWHVDNGPAAPAAPVGQYTGDARQAFWCFDEETARAIESLQSKHRGKAPLIGYVQEGKVVPQNSKTHQQVTLRFLPQDDGITFTLTGQFIDTVPDGRPPRWTGKPAGATIELPADGPPIEIHRITGPIKQLSPDTFALDFNRASFLNDRRGNEAWLVATWPGDGQFKRMVQQSMMQIPRQNTQGQVQTITFPELKAVPAGTTTVKLTATSDANVPVHFFVRGGPAEVDGDTLKLLPIPPRAKYPAKVTVVAWQWGRSTEPKLQTATPVERSFSILPAVASSSPVPNEMSFTPAEAGPGPVERIDTTYPWSLPMTSPQVERRAYLWVSPQCTRVRGVVVGLQNMLEKLMFQNGEFRDACAQANVAIVYIAPGSVSIHNDDPALSLGFKDPKEGSRQLHQFLADLAKESGYTEIEFAPLITVGHSAATPFVFGYTSVNPQRVIASIPYKGWFPGHVAQGVPILHVSSEWAEVGGKNWGTTWEKNDKPSVIRLRHDGENAQLGEYAEIGNGHYAWQPASGKILGAFIKKTVAARVPVDAPKNAEVKLNPLALESGVLVDPDTLGRPTFKAYPYNDYPGEKNGAYWYVDQDLAGMINGAMASQLAKKPQVVDFLVDGKPAPLDKKGVAEIAPKLLADGITWKVQACFLDVAPPQLNYSDEPLGHGTGQVYFRTGSGALKQVGPDTFRVWLGRGSIERQGPPWDPWVIATYPGDDQYRSADRPIHFWIDIKRKDGQQQSIEFPAIANIPAGSTSQITLNAKASSGLPVQYFVVSGPAEVADDGTLKLLPIPPSAEYPVKVIVGAYQWGRGVEPKFASADPVIREFLIDKPTP
jgi:hypothetical protein